VAVRPLRPTGWWLVARADDADLVAHGGVDPERLDAARRAARWLHDRVGGPLPCDAPDEVPVSDGNGPGADASWFVAPAGWPADAPENQVQGRALVEALGEALRRLHRLEPTADLPIRPNDALLDEAAERVRLGVVDPGAVDPNLARTDPVRLLDEARRLSGLVALRRPVTPVVTHGACRPGAVWLEHRTPRGFIDAGGLALADPYRDLAAMVRGLALAFGAEAVPGFFAGYGLDAPDPIRLELHALLDTLA
jgi:aminoglycoside phosphotransferase